MTEAIITFMQTEPVLQAKKRKKIKLGKILVLVFFILYLPSLFMLVFGKNVKIGMLMYGNIEDSLNTEGYFVRNEEVYKSPFKGKFVPDISEGEKVSAKSRAGVVVKDSSQDLLNEIKNIDLDMIRLQKNRELNNDIFSKDIQKIDDDIVSDLLIFSRQLNNNNYSNLKKARSNIDHLIQKKASVIRDLGGSDVYLNDLKSKKDKLAEKISLNTYELIANSSGIVMFSIDEYESVLTPGCIKNLTYNDLEKINVIRSSSDSENLITDPRKPFLKLIKDIDYYILFVLNSHEQEDLKVDDCVKIRINDIDKTFDGVIDYKSNEQQGNFIYSIKLDKGLYESAKIRLANIDVIKNLNSGLKIPKKSILNLDVLNKTGRIILLKSNRAKFTEVSIVCTDNEYAIINSKESDLRNEVNLYSKFILNPKNIQEGQIID